MRKGALKFCGESLCGQMTPPSIPPLGSNSFIHCRRMDRGFKNGKSLRTEDSTLSFFPRYGFYLAGV
jgi:hypothetical protein